MTKEYGSIKSLNLAFGLATINIWGKGIIENAGIDDEFGNAHIYLFNIKNKVTKKNNFFKFILGETPACDDDWLGPNHCGTYIRSVKRAPVLHTMLKIRKHYKAIIKRINNE